MTPFLARTLHTKLQVTPLLAAVGLLLANPGATSAKQQQQGISAFPSAAQQSGAVFSWRITPRYGLDGDGDGITDMPNTSEYVFNRVPGSCEPGPCGGVAEFSVVFDASDASLPGGFGPMAYHWSISPELQRVGGLPFPGWPKTHSSNFPTWTAALPEGRFTVALTVSRGTDSLQSVASIQVEDYLIVSLGDSYASGEGNPEDVIRAVTGGLQLDEITFENHSIRLTLATGSHNVFWADAGGGLSSVEQFNVRLVVDPEKHVELSSEGSSVGQGPNERHVRSHRSSLSAASQAALATEDADDRTSVTFVSLAESGARIDEGVLGPYEGAIKDSPLYPNSLPAQLAQLNELVGDRRIDALILTVGGNDIGFSRAVAALLVHRRLANEHVPFSLNDIARGVESGDWDFLPGFLDDFKDPRIIAGLSGLRSAYMELATALAESGLDIDGIYVTEYPDATREWRNGVLADCSPTLTNLVTWQNSSLATAALGVGMALGPAFGATLILGPSVFNRFGGTIAEIDTEEFRFARRRMIEPLNDSLRVIITRLNQDPYVRFGGWTLVDGIANRFAGHGLCAQEPYDPQEYADQVPVRRTPSARLTDPTLRWFRKGRESQIIQGPPINRLESLGTLHPNELGHLAIAQEILRQLPFEPRGMESETVVGAVSLAADGIALVRKAGSDLWGNALRGSCSAWDRHYLAIDVTTATGRLIRETLERARGANKPVAVWTDGTCLDGYPRVSRVQLPG